FCSRLGSRRFFRLLLWLIACEANGCRQNCKKQQTHDSHFLIPPLASIFRGRSRSNGAHFTGSHRQAFPNGVSVTIFRYPPETVPGGDVSSCWQARRPAPMSTSLGAALTVGVGATTLL